MSVRKRTDSAEVLRTLDLNETRWQAVLDAAPDAIVSIDTDGQITFFNSGAERIFGYGAEEVLGRSVAVLMPPPYAEEHLKYLRNYQQTGVTRAIGRIRDVRARRKNGETFPVELSVVEVRLGTAVAYAAIIRDVTERQETEEALRRERDFAERLIETAQVIILVLDTEGRIVRFNPYMEELSGYGLKEVRGKDWFSTFLPERDREHTRALFAKVVDRGTVDGNVNPIITGTGIEREIEWHAKTLRDAQGNVVGVLSVGRDVTEPRRAEQRRAAQYAVTRILARSTSLAEATPALLQAICEAVNWEIGELWYVDPEAGVLRQSGFWHVPSRDASAFEEASRQMTFSCGSGLPGRVWANGHPVCITDVVTETDFHRTSVALKMGLHGAFAFPIRNGGEVTGVMAFFCCDVRAPDADLLQMLEALGRQIGDFIEHKRAEESLREFQKLAQQRERLADIGAITAQIVHDLGNPLAALSMQAQLVLRRARRDESQPVSTVLKPMEQIVSEVHRLNSLIGEFMDFSREQRLDLIDIPLRRFLEGVVETWQPLASAREIALKLDIADGVQLLRADADKLGRVFDNLVKNAVEAIDQGPGRVSIRVGLPTDDKVCISVEDTGPGIPETVQAFRLFETTKANGSGLGLAIARQIVQAHGGSIEYGPAQPHGTVFHVELPRLGPLV